MCRLRCQQLSITVSLKLNTRELIDGHLLRSFVWTKKTNPKTRTPVSALCTHSFKDRQADGYTHPETQINRTLRESENKRGRKRRGFTQCNVRQRRSWGPKRRIAVPQAWRWPPDQTRTGLPAPPQSQIITGPPKTKENNLIGMPFECFSPMAGSSYKLYLLKSSFFRSGQLSVILIKVHLSEISVHFSWKKKQNKSCKSFIILTS